MVHAEPDGRLPGGIDEAPCAGGVSLNARLRSRLKEVADEAGVPIFTAQPKYCGDNAAMIAGLAFHHRRLEGDDALSADVDPSLEAGE